ncbi:MAG TPA: hypothetical protein VL200_09990 [Lacunisphaera sp.]|nr:hypothetical protein [Lacunisphaera sp.]
MDDTKPANEPNESGLNKIDLSQLESFSFGTQWTEVKPVSPGRRERDFDRGDRGDRRDGPGGRGAPRDRRGFQKAAGPAPAGAPPAPAGEGAPGGGERRRFDRGGAPFERRRDFRGERGDFREGGQRFERGPYLSPYFTATCYPEDVGFAAMVKAVRASCRTYQLFEITKAVLEKNERFVVVVQRSRPARPARPDRAPEPGAVPVEEGAPAAAAAPAPAAEKPAPLYMSLPDHLPFETEDAAIQHVLTNNLGAFFDMQEIEVEAPKGNFPIINKCGITGELLGPPNHHRYQQILQQHHATRLSRMSFDRFRESIISVREPEVIAQWQEKMKKATRYTWKPPVAKSATTPPVEAAPAAAAPAAPATADPAAAPGSEAAPAAEPTPPAAAPEAIAFDTLEEARVYLLANARDRVVRAVDSVRFHGKLIEKLPPGEIRRAIEGHVERQRRFPLDTANALRGRLRREGFTIFKKGSRGVSYVCAVKRRFRVPGQAFSETISTLIDFIEKNPMVHVKDLPKNFLGIDLAAALAATPLPEGTPQSQAPFLALGPEQSERLRKMSNDLRWLVMEGYVTEFSDGKLFAPPPMAPQAARKAEAGEEEHDPVDFPDAPAPAASEATANPPAAAAPEAATAPGAAVAPAPTDAPGEAPPLPPEAPAETAAAPAANETTKPENPS